ncbi:MAG: hypothetical protein WA786_02000 [Acidimicrobiales bacterium]
MELTRVLAPLAQLGQVARVVAEQSGPIVLSCSDANSVMAAATLRGQVDRPIGVWLVVSTNYSAALAARDVATLSWLIDLEHVVVSAEHQAASHAQVLEALLTNDEVTIRNDVARVTGAYNRPAPPKAITVWSYDGNCLRSGATTLVEFSGAHFDDVTLTTFT